MSSTYVVLSLCIGYSDGKIVFLQTPSYGNRMLITVCVTESDESKVLPRISHVIWCASSTQLVIGILKIDIKMYSAYSRDCVC